MEKGERTIVYGKKEKVGVFSAVWCPWIIVVLRWLSGCGKEQTQDIGGSIGELTSILQ